MKTIRVLTRAQSTAHRLFVTAAIAMALIAGLLAMHTLGTPAAHVEPAHAVSASSSSDVTVGDGARGAAEGGAVSAAAHPDHCTGGCDAPGHPPTHSMLLMVCALALLAAVIIIMAPARLSRLSLTLGGLALVRDATRALPRPHPPSLLVLSISRT